MAGFQQQIKPLTARKRMTTAFITMEINVSIRRIEDDVSQSGTSPSEKGENRWCSGSLIR
jgi:hypothetical protein